MSTVCKSAQYYCRVFKSINGRRINYKYIIATNSFMCVITIRLPFVDIYIYILLYINILYMYIYVKKYKSST